MNTQTITILVAEGVGKEIEATVIGQIAIHHPAKRKGVDTSRWFLTHVHTGHYFWAFDGGTIFEELVRLAHLLAPFDFDAYAAGGYQDKQFVADVKEVIRKWDTHEDAAPEAL